MIPSFPGDRKTWDGGLGTGDLELVLRFLGSAYIFFFEGWLHVSITHFQMGITSNKIRASTGLLLFHFFFFFYIPTATVWHVCVCVSTHLFLCVGRGLGHGPFDWWNIVTSSIKAIKVECRWRYLNLSKCLFTRSRRTQIQYNTPMEKVAPAAAKTQCRIPTTKCLPPKIGTTHSNTYVMGTGETLIDAVVSRRRACG